MNKKNCELILLITAIFWGLGIAVTDIVLKSGINVFEFISIRFFVGFCAMSLYYKNINKISKREWIFGIISGALLFLSFGFQTLGLKHTTVANTSLYVGTTAMLTPFTAYFVSRKKILKREVAAGLILLLALYVNQLGSVSKINFGDCLVLFSSLLFALNISVVAKYFKDIDKINMTTISLLACSLMAFFCYEMGGNSYDFNSIINVLGLFIFIGVVTTAMAFIVQNLAVDYTSDAKISYILATESIWGVIFAVILFGEKLTVNFLFSLVLMVVGFIVSEYCK